MPRNILLVAGETSGDILAAHVLQGLRQQGCHLPVWGVGGERLEALGMECIASIDALAVRGYAEVLGALPRLWSLRRGLMAQAAYRRPSLCITVDAPDFNLGLAAKLKAQGIPTLHFISPSIWAWRRERLPKIKAAIDTMLCVFPHEPPLYQAVGMHAQYVGHPMAQTVPSQSNKTAALAALDLQTIQANHRQRVVALLPGSRMAEITYILPRMLAAAKILLAQDRNLTFVLPVASAALLPKVHMCLRQYPDMSIRVLQGQASLALAAANVALVASGTATLEAALYQVPMVICYAMPHLSWLMMRHKNYLPWVGLPNILCQDWIVPELLQADANPAALAEAVWALLNDSARSMVIRQRFSALHQDLHLDTQALAARAILRVLRQ